MPAWLISIILNLVLKIGIPALVAWLKKVFGFGANSEVVAVLTDYVEESKENKRAARQRARRRLRECCGVGCPSDTKGLG